MLLSIIFPFAFSGFHISKQWDLRAARRGREGTGGSFSANSGLGIVSELCIGAIAGGCGGAAEGFERLREKALLYAISTLEKSFNPSADHRFTLVFRANMAERFDFQTLQHCSAVQRRLRTDFTSIFILRPPQVQTLFAQLRRQKIRSQALFFQSAELCSPGYRLSCTEIG